MEIRRIKEFFYGLVIVLLTGKLIRFLVNNTFTRNRGMMHEINDIYRAAIAFLFRLDSAVFFMIPVVLAFTLISERKSQSVIQAQFLPARRFTPQLAKLSAVMVLSCIIVAIDSITDTISTLLLLYINDGFAMYYNPKSLSACFMRRILETAIYYHITLNSFRYLPTTAIRYLNVCLFYSSLIILAHNVMTAVRRYSVFYLGSDFHHRYHAYSILHDTLSVSFDFPPGI